MSNNNDYRGNGSRSGGSYSRSGSSGRSGSSNRRRRKKRATGRFYAVVATALIIVVALCVGLPKLLRGGNTTVAPVSGGDAQTGGSADTQASTSGATDETGTKSIQALIEENDDLAPLEGSEKVQTQGDLNVNKSLPSEWRNILLLGTDSRFKDKVSRTDTMMIASVNASAGRIKLVSIMRDMMVDIPGHGQNKMNACVYFGGPELLMQVLNEKLHLNITEYAMVNFYSFQYVVDAIGGVDIDITEEEMERINSVLGDAAKAAGMAQEDWNRDEMELKTFGTLTHLNGMQTLSYARIRHIDSDYQRTQRQRTVLNAILQKVKSEKMSISEMMPVARVIFDYMDTNIAVSSALALASSVIEGGIGDIEEWRLPCKDSSVSEVRNGTSAFWDVDYEKNAQTLYTFIYDN